MGGRSRILVCLAVGALALTAPAMAVAQGGTTTSAGDQQYIDPLNSTTSTTSTSPAPSTSASPSAPPAGSSSSASSSSASSSPAATSTSSQTPTTASASSGRTLPFTGFNLAIPIAVGLGLFGTGLLLRRLTRRA